MVLGFGAPSHAGPGASLTPSSSRSEGLDGWAPVLESSPGIALTNPGNQTSTRNAGVSLQLVASDPYGAKLTYSATNLPAGLTVNSSTGQIAGVLTYAGVGTYDVTVSATDGTLTATQGFTWTVTISFAQSNYSIPPNAAAMVTVPFAGSQAAGSLNVVAVGWNDSSSHVSSVTDTQGNAYVRAVGPTVVPGTATHSIYYAANIVSAAAGNVVTVTFTSPAARPDIRIAEYRGIDPVHPIDVTVEATGSSSFSDSGSVTTMNANDLLVGANIVQTGTTDAGSGYTARSITYPNGDILEEQVVTTTGLYGATAPLSPPSAWIMQMVAFRFSRVDQPPMLPAIANQFSARNTSVSLQILASDPDGDQLTYGATGLPA